MEILNKIQDIQYELEDALRMEIDYEDVRETKDGKRLLRYLRRRHRIINHFIKILGGLT